MRSKRGGDKVISVYWFIILLVVAGGLVLMVNLFYNSPYDVRKIEGDLLAKKLSNCIYFGGSLNPFLIDQEGNFLDSFKNNFMSECSISFGNTDVPDYYVEANIYNYRKRDKPIYNFSEGNSDWKVDCDFEDEDYEKFAVCTKKVFFVVDDKDTPYFVEVLSIIGKVEKNVR